jgi:hypothetical protein
MTSINSAFAEETFEIRQGPSTRCGGHRFLDGYSRCLRLCGWIGDLVPGKSHSHVCAGQHLTAVAAAVAAA